jgi:hypothetical protein
MATEQSPSKPPKVAIYDRPAGADRPWRTWIVWGTALAVSAAWGAYYFWLR